MEALIAVERSNLALETFGVDLVSAGYFREAEQKFRHLIEVDPLSSNAWWRLSGSLSAQGLLEEAKQAARRADELDPGYDNSGQFNLIAHALIAGDDEEAIRILALFFDVDFYRYARARAFVEAMRHPQTGRESLQEWVGWHSTHAEYLYEKVAAQFFFLFFGHMDLYTGAIDSYGPGEKGWNDADVLESYGQILPAMGYRKTQHYLDRAKGNGLFELWDHRGAPDHCSKETGEWVCH